MAAREGREMQTKVAFEREDWREPEAGRSAAERCMRRKHRGSIEPEAVGLGEHQGGARTGRKRWTNRS